MLLLSQVIYCAMQLQSLSYILHFQSVALTCTFGLKQLDESAICIQT